MPTTRNRLQRSRSRNGSREKIETIRSGSCVSRFHPRLPARRANRVLKNRESNLPRSPSASARQPGPKRKGKSRERLADETRKNQNRAAVKMQGPMLRKTETRAEEDNYSCESRRGELSSPRLFALRAADFGRAASAGRGNFRVAIGGRIASGW